MFGFKISGSSYFLLGLLISQAGIDVDLTIIDFSAFAAIPSGNINEWGAFFGNVGFINNKAGFFVPAIQKIDLADNLYISVIFVPGRLGQV